MNTVPPRDPDSRIRQACQLLGGMQYWTKVSAQPCPDRLTALDLLVDELADALGVSRRTE